MPKFDRDTGAPGKQPEGRRSASDVAVALRNQIVSDRYIENDRLPSERALAERFGVSRTTVRAALQRLEKMGMITRMRGSGTYIRHSDFAETRAAIRATGPLELIDARLAVEPHVARLAALAASGNNIHELEIALNAVEACTSEEDGFSGHDERFHHAIAACTRNALLVWVSTAINRVRCHEQWSEMKRRTLTPRTIIHYNQQHRMIYVAIRRRDAEGAAQAATAHLLSARESLMKAGLPAPSA